MILYETCLVHTPLNQQRSLDQDLQGNMEQCHFLIISNSACIQVCALVPVPQTAQQPQHSGRCCSYLKAWRVKRATWTAKVHCLLRHLQGFNISWVLEFKDIFSKPIWNWVDFFLQQWLQHYDCQPGSVYKDLDKALLILTAINFSVSQT